MSALTLMVIRHAEDFPSRGFTENGGKDDNPW